MIHAVPKHDALALPTWGGPLTPGDYVALAKSWITNELADQALLRRVDSPEGSQIVGRRDNGSYSGIVFPYVWPGEQFVREYWLRRDRPEIEYDSDNRPREKNKYLGPPGCRNLLYFVPGTEAELLGDAQVAVAVTEGAKKTIALHRLSRYGVPSMDRPRFLPVGLGGVWNWKGTIGKARGPDGSRRDVKGTIPDLDRIAWATRLVYVVYDSNVHTNSSVAAARKALTAELKRRAAKVLWVNLPEGEPRAHG